ncbi:dipeptidyl peptidase III [Hesseltinella vesiculosa]|uniref:Dipeptidyl peptidase 3 n=1 Tax=Hesseltinella vesiculosa TaxID=101127 RepID=A0A1X2GMC8_9FUNG|nr:dipeptidyl peptidase III [Hesseltinella vesiculosa]
MSSQTNASRYLADAKTPFSLLEAKPYFDTLSNTEKLYAHHMSRAAFNGARITLIQTNPEANAIYDLIMNLFSTQAGDLVSSQSLQEKSGVSAEAFDALLQYCGQFLGNLSNYKSFGDEKFIPRIAEADFEKVVAAAPQAEKVMALFESCKGEIYSVDPVAKNLLGYPDDGHLSGYYSANITKDDIKTVQSYLETLAIYPLNTRLFKTEKGYELMVASSDEATEHHTFPDGNTLTVTYGDFKDQMAKVNKHIHAAQAVSANENQTNMLISYHDSFKTGSVLSHMESQRHWLRDLSPRVETNIGFIETYRDPQGVRAEWEGFVAMVNEAQTEKFNKLVEQAPVFVSRLPWPATFERETINKPDFTSLEVLSFATCGVPAGINIPNYAEVTQKLGSKNVSLGNVISASSPGEKFPFIRSDDLELYARLRNPSFELQVGTHEMGHGTGKLFTQDDQGNLNFDPSSTTHPFTQEPVNSWYKPGQSFNSVFKNIGGSYEECRAECIALTLGPEEDILDIFGYHGQDADDIVYIMYLNMARAGLCALEYFDPEAKKWGQAHMMARYAITATMMQAGQGFLEFKNITDSDGKASLEIHLDRSKIKSVGRPAIAKFLEQLQVFKATADEAQGTELYNEKTAVPDDWLLYRGIVISHKQPRKVFIQANTFIQPDGQVLLKEYEATPMGMIQSFLERDL